jgi:glycerophosphoryl diester phosphodiesterase
VPEPGGQPWVIAHRGDHRATAENSLAAFDAAARSGCDMIETDLRRCRDGIVICHDAQVGGRRVASMTRREIGAETGLLPPGLDEVLQCCRGRIGVNLELKEEGLEAAVLAAVAPIFGPSQYLISSFHASVLRTVRSLDRAARTGLLSARGLPRLLLSRGLEPDPRPAAGVLAAMRDCGADFLIPDVLDRELIALAADRGTPLILWYANTGDQIAQALSITGLAGVITDSPHLIRQSLSSRVLPAR